MALRPFTRHPKNPTDDEATPEEEGGIDQFFSHGARPGGTSSNSVDQGGSAAAQLDVTPLVDAADAGWYADASDPQIKRYWDGHHWTGQTMRVVQEDAPASKPAGDPAGGTAHSRPRDGSARNRCSPRHLRRPD